jgi:nanoRNase/pAp phosphatase (c-di-AMP/oligoRNAs hydrolase)
MRLLTRSDFDGLACGALLKEMGVIDSWKFVHPRDMQEGLVEVTENDVLANVPYVKGCKMWFDHHTSENERLGSVSFTGASHFAPSCARVIYDYYGGDGKLARFKNMVGEVDKVDSGNLGIKDIMEPEGWVLLGLIMDPRTGLGRFKDFAVSNYELMEKLIDACRSMTIEEIIALPDVQERVKLYWEQNEIFKGMLERHSRIDGNVIVTDLRGVGSIAAGNRFLIYSLFPEQNISVWVVDGKERNCAIAVGHSIVNRTSNTNVGSLMLKYGGGGHRQVGTCQVDYDEANRIINELVERMKKDG